MCTLGYERKTLLFMGAQLGKLERDRLLGDFERWLKGSLEVELLSLWELCEGNLERGLLCWGSWRIGRIGSGDGHLFPWGAPRWGTWKGFIYQGL